MYDFKQKFPTASKSKFKGLLSGHFQGLESFQIHMRPGKLPQLNARRFKDMTLMLAFHSSNFRQIGRVNKMQQMIHVSVTAVNCCTTVSETEHEKVCNT